jgi:hypothetical protein
MHPAIRILLLLIITGFMVTGHLYALVAGIVLSIALYSTRILAPDAHLLRMILRMRWFFLSIMILYAWFTPGTALLPVLQDYSPTQQGLKEGLVRCSVLIVILSLVHWLVRTSSREELIQGIYWLARPMKWVGLKPEVMAVRLALVLEMVPIIQGKLWSRPVTAEAHTTHTRQIVKHAVAVLDNALYEADNAERIEIELATGQPPALSEWLILGVVVALMTMLILLPK